jgi:TonB family protein
VLLASRPMKLVHTLLIAVAATAALSAQFCLGENRDVGRALIEHAKQMSDIRSSDAMPFRLSVSFTLFQQGELQLSGTYREFWVSRGQWRRETVLGKFHYTEVGGRTKRWLLSEPQGIPPAAVSVWYATDLTDAIESRDVVSIQDRNLNGVALQCAETKTRGSTEKKVLCFDKDVGLVVARMLPSYSGNRVTVESCLYSDYQKFERWIFPRTITCYEDDKRTLEAKVVELVPFSTSDSALFAPLPGADVRVNCQSKVNPPKPLQTPEPSGPGGPKPNAPVVISMVIDEQGKPRDLKVTRSMGQQFDDAALNAVRNWRFQPSTCDGSAVPVVISVELAF